MNEIKQEQKYKTLSEFWPFYVTEHRVPLNRQLHFIGTSLMLVLLLVTIIRRDIRLLPVVIITPYAWAWAGHYLVEKNRPATFKYPFKSLISDFIMYGKIWQGKMDAEVEKYSKARG